MLRRTPLRELLGLAALAAVAGLVVLSLSPQSSFARTGMPGILEHVVAYWGAAALAGLRVPRSRQRWLCVFFVILAAMLEIGQIWVPGRTSQVVDFAASSVGAGLGIAFAAACLGSPQPGERAGLENWARVKHRVGIGLVFVGVAITPVWIALLLWFGLKLLAGLLR